MTLTSHCLCRLMMALAFFECFASRNLKVECNAARPAQSVRRTSLSAVPATASCHTQCLRSVFEGYMLSSVDIGSTDAIQSALHTHRCRLDGYPALSRIHRRARFRLLSHRTPALLCQSRSIKARCFLAKLVSIMALIQAPRAAIAYELQDGITSA